MLGRPVYILDSIRTPFVKSMTLYNDISTQDLMIATLNALVTKASLENQLLGDSGFGAVINSSANWNLGRESVLGTKLDPHSPSFTLQRACGTSLEISWILSLKIANNEIENAIAGGVDTNSDLPIMISRSLTQKLLAFNQAKDWTSKLKLIPSFLDPANFKLIFPGIVEPRTGLSMGQHCEKMVREWKISRQEQDELALRSHQNAAKAYDDGFYNDLVFEFHGIKRDGIVRADTTLEKLATLKTVFKLPGETNKDLCTLTAGNSSPLTDGSAAVLLGSSEYANQFNHTPLARFIDAEVAAVDFVHGEGLLMAPTIAVSKLLARNNLQLQDFDFYEIHEAFAGQVLCTLKAWQSDDYCKKVLKRPRALGSIDLTKLNIKGGSVAIGHPFAATGARIVGALAKMLSQNGGKGRGLISICTAGGMGVAAILEGIDQRSS